MIDEFENLCSSRKSIRKFTDKSIEKNKIMKILNIINSAPSAGNLQAYEVIVVKSKDKLEIYMKLHYIKSLYLKHQLYWFLWAKYRNLQTYGKKRRTTVLYPRCNYCMHLCNACL